MTEHDREIVDSDPAEQPVAVVVADDPAESAYVATMDGRVVGVLRYERPRAGVIDLQHTVVRPEGQGRGVGTALIRDAFDQARRAGDRVIPSCPFIPPFLEKHPEQRDIVIDGP